MHQYWCTKFSIVSFFTAAVADRRRRLAWALVELSRGGLPAFLDRGTAVFFLAMASLPSWLRVAALSHEGDQPNAVGATVAPVKPRSLSGCTTSANS